MTDQTAGLPRGILGDNIDRLLKERENLGAVLRTISSEQEEAGAAPRPAGRADRQPYAAERRKPDGNNPGRRHEAAAEAALEVAQRQLAAVREALDANERDLLQLLAEQLEELSAGLEERTQSVRSEALELLDQASRAILQFSELSAVQRWIENPLQPNGQSLRPFALDPLHVQACSPKSGSLLTVGAVIDVLGERLESGSVDAQLRRAARETRVRRTSAERISESHSGPHGDQGERC